MKKIPLILLILFFVPQSKSTAQEVFNYVYESSQKIVNNPKSDKTNARIAQFKCAALEYLKKNTFEQKSSVPATFLDSQAYFMSEFLSLFFKEVIANKNLTPDIKKKRILMFMDASCSNPMFYDTNKEEINIYIDAGNQLTPFCLDTDWEKALAAAKSQL